MRPAPLPLSPAPTAAELPARLPSPFAGAPHPLARRAAAALVAELEAGALLDAADRAALAAPGGGKMFGVLVVAGRDGGAAGVLFGFSGMLGGRWSRDGFVPPLFDVAARDAFWPAGEAALAALEARHRELDAGAEVVALRAALADLDRRQADELAALTGRHRAARDERRAARAGLAADDRAARHALDQRSRADGAERRRALADHAAARAARLGPLAAIDDARRAVAATRAERSRELYARIHDGYVVASARGERRPLRALFAPDVPPGGAGDCAAPKLLAHAHRLGLRPLALAELWWGAPPSTGGRRAGGFYPACRGKCGPLLPFMLDGLPCEPAPIFGDAPPGPDEPRAIDQDPWLVVVDKPRGLLSVPGRSGRLTDSVATRLRRRFPDASGPLVVHRLDLDTSGLLLAALTADVHAALQRQFARRAVDKRYVAVLAGEVRGERGVVELPLRVDLDDRPRQIVDPVHGRAALTEWEVVDRGPGTTRVAMWPRTGRTHQLRVHAAVGLGAPIVGDRLYGDPAERMMLHAESLAFDHPITSARLELASPAPF